MVERWKKKQRKGGKREEWKIENGRRWERKQGGGGRRRRKGRWKEKQGKGVEGGKMMEDGRRNKGRE